jgi:RND family efflux transporter MFP subunit
MKVNMKTMHARLKTTLLQTAWLGLAALCVPAQAAAEKEAIKGTTRCAADLSLALPATGRIARMLVQEGSVVSVGQPMLQLDRAAEELDVERRRVQWQGQAEVVTAQARKETAEMQVVAARRIYAASKGISREELENRELAFATTVSELERLKTVKEMERLDYLTAKENLERRSLRAPTRGIVTKLIRQVGESVQANEAVLKLCDLSKILFVANVPSARSEHLHMGNKVGLLVGDAGTPVQGRVIFVSPVIDPASGLREIKIELIKPGAQVRPGVPASLNLGD